MKIKFIIFIKLCLLLLSTYTVAQEKSKFYIVDYLTNKPIEYVQIYSLCQTNEVIFSDEKGMGVRDQKEISCPKWELSHINYEVLQINESDFFSVDTIRMNPMKYEIEEVNIMSKKIDNQYLYDRVNALIKKIRKNSVKTTTNYFFVLSSKTGNEVRENVCANLKIDYNHINGFQRKDNSFVDGSFLFNKEAIFLNLNTDKLILSFSPFSEEHNEFSLPLNNKKVSKKSHNIKRLVCNSCKDTEYLIQISSLKDDKITILKFDFISLIPIEYHVNISELMDKGLLRLNNEKSSIDNFKLKYVFDNKNELINLVEFVFDIKFKDSQKTRIFGFFNRIFVSSTTSHIIKGKYSPDNLYEEISLSIPDSLSFKFKHNELAKILEIKDLDFKKLSSINPEILALFLSLPKSKNKFLAHGKERINYNEYKTHLLEKEYWYYKYEKKIFNNSFLNFNWVYKFKTTDSLHWKIESRPTLWNSNYSIIYAPYIDTIHFNFFTNIIFDWVETQRIKLFSSFGKMIHNNDMATISNQIDTSFKVVNDSAQNLLFKFIDEKVSFEEVDKLNCEIKEILGVDNLYTYFKTEIPKIINDQKYESTIMRYLKCAYQNEFKDTTYFKYCLERSIILLEDLIKYYEALPSMELKNLGSYYGLKAESYMMLKDINSACQCLNKYNKYWPGTIEYSSKKKLFYQIHCKE